MSTALAVVDDCTIVCKPNPLRSESYFSKVQAGQTLLQMLGAEPSHSLSVSIGGYPIPRELWARIKPKPGQYIHVVNYPQGGNGGKWLRSILLIVVAIVAIAVSDGALAPAFFGAYAGVAGAAIGIVGSMTGAVLLPNKEMP